MRRVRKRLLLRAILALGLLLTISSAVQAVDPWTSNPPLEPPPVGYLAAPSNIIAPSPIAALGEPVLAPAAAPLGAGLPIPLPAVAPAIPPPATSSPPAPAPPPPAEPISTPSTMILVKPCDDPPPIKPPWSGTLEFGINGANGNSDLLKLRSGLTTKHETESHIWSNDLTYNYANNQQVTTENRALLKERYEWLFGKSPWNVFDEGELEYDQFKSYDLRLADHAGVGYAWLKDGVTTLKTRLGAGESWKIDGPDAGGTTEALLGLDFERKLSDRQKFITSAEVFPALNSLGDFRSEAKIGYELLIDPVWNLTLKVGATDRYDSQATGKNPNDVEYFGVLIWKF